MLFEDSLVCHDPPSARIHVSPSNDMSAPSLPIDGRHARWARWAYRSFSATTSKLHGNIVGRAPTGMLAGDSCATDDPRLTRPERDRDSERELIHS